MRDAKTPLSDSIRGHRRPAYRTLRSLCGGWAPGVTRSWNEDSGQCRASPQRGQPLPNGHPLFGHDVHEGDRRETAILGDAKHGINVRMAWRGSLGLKAFVNEEPDAPEESGASGRRGAVPAHGNRHRTVVSAKREVRNRVSTLGVSKLHEVDTAHRPWLEFLDLNGIALAFVECALVPGIQHAQNPLSCPATSDDSKRPLTACQSHPQKQCRKPEAVVGVAMGEIHGVEVLGVEAQAPERLGHRVAAVDEHRRTASQQHARVGKRRVCRFAGANEQGFHGWSVAQVAKKRLGCCRRPDNLPRSQRSPLTPALRGAFRRTTKARWKAPLSCTSPACAMAIITILGAGMMGSALAVPLVDAGHEVRLVGTHLDGALIEGLRRHRVHPTLRAPLPSEIQVFTIEGLETALQNTDCVALGVSSPGVRWAGQQLRARLDRPLPIVMITKGLEWNGDGLQILPDVLKSELQGHPAGALDPVAVAGPCIAGELAARVDTCVVLTSRSVSQAEHFRNLMRTRYYRLWVAPDVVGSEICAALKNAYAMGIAFATGQHEMRGGSPGSVAMHNAEAALFAQSVFEMQRVIEICGGDRASAAWLPGAGDLDVTCSGGRTGRFGKLLGLGIGRDAAIERMAGATLESLEILAVMRKAWEGLQAKGRLGDRELPLLRHLAAVALDDAPVAPPYDDFF